jgi:hypothetical protein
MLPEFQLTQALAALLGGSTAHPEGASEGEVEITFGSGVQLTAPDQVSDETQLADQVNSAEIDTTTKKLFQGIWN